MNPCRSPKVREATAEGYHRFVNGSMNAMRSFNIRIVPSAVFRASSSKSSEAFISAIADLQDRAEKLGGNAIVAVRSTTKTELVWRRKAGPRLSRQPAHLLQRERPARPRPDGASRSSDLRLPDGELVRA